MKTKVIVIADDQRYNEYNKNDRGYIDGYVRGGDDVPYAVVVIDRRIVLIPTTNLTVSHNNQQP